jgi:L-threonylcarbamoyladenylate synthase
MARIVPPTREWIAAAAEELRSGGLVAFPSETVYGLGANALSSEASERIFAAKGRPATNPLIVHVGQKEEYANVAEPSADAERLIDAFWPGPLSLILPKQSVVSDVVTAGGPTVAVRMPDHPVALALLRATRLPLAAPSANRSEAVSPTTAEHVAESLGDAIDLILDGGPCGVGLESTVLNLTVSPLRIERPGAVTTAQIEAVLGVRPTDGGRTKAAFGRHVSPGQMRRHYAPSTPLRLVSREEMDDEMALASANGIVLGAILRGRSGQSALEVTLPDDPAAYGRGLYAALRQLDQAGCDLLLVEAPPEGGEWAAIRDRLTRASQRT